jgi:arginine:ornithine antiporter/lysine permease
MAVIYTLFMIYAGGLKFILLSAILFAPGTLLYYIARREQGKAVFDKTSDWVIFGLIVAAALYCIYGLSTGALTI